MVVAFKYELTPDDEKYKEMRKNQFKTENKIPGEGEMNYEQKMMVERIDRLLKTWIYYAKALHDFNALTEKLKDETTRIQNSLAEGLRYSKERNDYTAKQESMLGFVKIANRDMKTALDNYTSALKGLGQAATDVGVKFNFTMVGQLKTGVKSIVRSLKRSYSERAQDQEKKRMDAAYIKKKRILTEAREKPSDEDLESSARTTAAGLSLDEMELSTGEQEQRGLVVRGLDKAYKNAQRSIADSADAAAAGGVRGGIDKAPLLANEAQPGGGRKRSYKKKRRRSKKRSYKRRSTKRRSKKRSYKKRSYKRRSYKKRRSTKRRYTRRN